MIRNTCTRVSRIVSWPATLLHELTHMLLAVPWAAESAIIVDEDGPACYVTWATSAPRWGIVLASLGPTLLGAIVGVLGLWQLATSPPGSLNQLLLSAGIAAYWVIYVAPSEDDLAIPDAAADPQTTAEDLDQADPDLGGGQR